MRYAESTSVSVEKSRAEIEQVVTRYGATSFASGWQGDRATVMFEMKDRRVRFTLPLPDREDRAFRYSSVRRTRRTDEETLKAWEQGCRQRWRALLLCIRAKLEAVESKIASFDEEFMAFVILPSGMTIAETILPGLPAVLAGHPLPPLLPGPITPTAEDIQ